MLFLVDQFLPGYLANIFASSGINFSLGMDQRYSSGREHHHGVVQVQSRGVYGLFQYFLGGRGESGVQFTHQAHQLRNGCMSESVALPLKHQQSSSRNKLLRRSAQ